MPRTSSNRPTPISLARMNKGLSVKEVAERMGATSTTIYEIEKGTKRARVTIARYLRALELDIEKPETLPENVIFIDEGSLVALSS